MVLSHVTEYFKSTTMDDGDTFVMPTDSLAIMKEAWHVDSWVIKVWSQRGPIQTIHSHGLQRCFAMAMKIDW